VSRLRRGFVGSEGDEQQIAEVRAKSAVKGRVAISFFR